MCVVRVREGEAYCPIINNTTEKKRLTLRPLEQETLDNYKNKISLMIFDRKNENPRLCPSKIRSDYIHSEERKAIIKSVEEYADIFHVKKFRKF